MSHAVYTYTLTHSPELVSNNPPIFQAYVYISREVGANIEIVDLATPHNPKLQERYNDRSEKMIDTNIDGIIDSRKVCSEIVTYLHIKRYRPLESMKLFFNMYYRITKTQERDLRTPMP